MRPPLDEARDRLPPPRTFAEGQRLVYGLLAAAGGMFCGGMAVAMIGLLMWGGWSKGEEHSIVIIFGCSLGGFIIAMIAVIVGLLAGGPVGRFKVSATRDGASLEADGDRDDGRSSGSREPDRPQRSGDSTFQRSDA